MSIYEACMEGLAITQPTGDMSNVDFVVSNREATLVVKTWWWYSDWATSGAQSDGFLYYAYPLLEDALGWFIAGPPGEARLGTPDERVVEAVQSCREWQDLNRGAYVSHLARLREAFPEFDMAEWVALFLQRPKIDFDAALRQQNLGNRKIGSISLIGADNEVVDALVLDENGNAATARGNPWLESFAGDWRERQVRPEVESYINWVAQERPYGPYQVSSVKVTVANGGVEELAAGAVA
jgi:hypothetical protein